MTTEQAPRLGSWVRTGNLVGVVAAVEDGAVAVFDPASRQLTRVDRDEVEAVPSGAVTVRAEVDLPLAHGLDESDVRRWLAALVDPVVRERSTEVLRGEHLDVGVALPAVRVTVQAAERGGAVCLCGQRVPAPDGAALVCPACGRQAVARPTSGRSTLPGSPAGSAASDGPDTSPG